jgi:hypothetical protein
MKPLLRWTLVVVLFSFINCAARAQGLLRVSPSPGQPFSATVETLRTQTLAEGTRIQTRAKSLVYRDSAGRVAYYNYQPVGLDEAYPDSPNFIEIADKIAGFGYFVFPQRSHVATRYSLTPRVSSPPRSAPPKPSQPEPKFTSESLGTQDILGFSVTGERVTRTYPVGMEHNDRPITVVIETWSSPELGLVFLRKGSDPRTGDEEARVTSFEQSEPDPALFRLPTGYTFEDQKPR